MFTVGQYIIRNRKIRECAPPGTFQLEFKSDSKNNSTSPVYEADAIPPSWAPPEIPV